MLKKIVTLALTLALSALVLGSVESSVLAVAPMTCKLPEGSHEQGWESRFTIAGQPPVSTRECYADGNLKWWRLQVVEGDDWTIYYTKHRANGTLAEEIVIFPRKSSGIVSDEPPVVVRMLSTQVDEDGTSINQKFVADANTFDSTTGLPSFKIEESSVTTAVPLSLLGTVARSPTGWMFVTKRLPDGIYQTYDSYPDGTLETEFQQDRNASTVYVRPPWAPHYEPAENRRMPEGFLDPNWIALPKSLCAALKGSPATLSPYGQDRATCSEN